MSTIDTVNEDGDEGVEKNGYDPNIEGGTHWEKALVAFTLLKAKIATTPILRHFDPLKQLVIVVYANKCAVSAS